MAETYDRAGQEKKGLQTSQFDTAARGSANVSLDPCSWTRRKGTLELEVALTGDVTAGGATGGGGGGGGGGGCTMVGWGGGSVFGCWWCRWWICCCCCGCVTLTVWGGNFVTDMFEALVRCRLTGRSWSWGSDACAAGDDELLDGFEGAAAAAR